MSSKIRLTQVPHIHDPDAFLNPCRVETADAVAMKDSHKQIGIKEDTYTLIVKDKSGSSESYRVKIKFEGNEKPTIIYVRKLAAGIAKVQVLFDILLLHRYVRT